MIDIHPTSTGGGGLVVPRRTTYQPGDLRQEILKCYQCGFPFRIGKDTEGPSLESPGVTHTTFLGSTNFVNNPGFDGLGKINAPVVVGLNNLLIPGWALDRGVATSNYIDVGKSVLISTTYMDIGMFNASGGFPSLTSKVFAYQNIPNWKSLAGSIISVSVEIYNVGESNVDGFYIDDGVTVQNSSIADNNSTTSQVISGIFSISPNATQVILGVGHLVSSIYSFYLRNPTIYKYEIDTNVVGGCRLCGSMNPRGIGRNDGAFETGVDFSNR